MSIQKILAAMGVCKNPKMAEKKGKFLDNLPTFVFIELYASSPAPLLILGISVNFGEIVGGIIDI